MLKNDIVFYRIVEYVIGKAWNIFMQLNQKLEILINRKGVKKTEFAASVGITYRALANYLSGSRTPKRSVFEKIAEALETDIAFLADNSKNLVLTSEERFIFNSSSDSKGISEASDYLEKTRGLFAGNLLSEDDKQALFACLTEIYFDAKERAKKYGKH